MIKLLILFNMDNSSSYLYFDRMDRINKEHIASFNFLVKKYDSKWEELNMNHKKNLKDFGEKIINNNLNIYNYYFLKIKKI